MCVNTRKEQEYVPQTGILKLHYNQDTAQALVESIQYFTFNTLSIRGYEIEQLIQEEPSGCT